MDFSQVKNCQLLMDFTHSQSASYLITWEGEKGSI